MTTGDKENRVSDLTRTRKSRPKLHAARSPAFLLAHLQDAEKHIGWNKNAILYRIIFRKLEDGWQAIVKAKRGEEKGVAFVTTRTFADCIEVLSLKLSDGTLDWKRDKSRY